MSERDDRESRQAAQGGTKMGAILAEMGPVMRRRRNGSCGVTLMLNFSNRGWNGSADSETRRANESEVMVRGASWG